MRKRAGTSALAAIIAALMLGLALPRVCHAEKADRDRPVNIEADRMKYDDLRQINVFEGNVTLTQGTLIIRADRLTVRQDPEGFQRGSAEKGPGGMAYFKQKREGFDEYVEGWGERIEYDARLEKAELTTRARILRGTDEVRGNVITYDGRTESYNVTGGRESGSVNNPDGRVRAVISPRSAPAGSERAAAEKDSGLRLKRAGGLGAPRDDYPETPRK